MIRLDVLKEAFKSARQSKRDYVESKLNEHGKFLLKRLSGPGGTRYVFGSKCGFRIHIIS